MASLRVSSMRIGKLVGHFVFISIVSICDVSIDDIPLQTAHCQEAR